MHNKKCDRKPVKFFRAYSENIPSKHPSDKFCERQTSRERYWPNGLTDNICPTKILLDEPLEQVSMHKLIKHQKILNIIIAAPNASGLGSLSRVHHTYSHC